MSTAVTPILHKRSDRMRSGSGMETTVDDLRAWLVERYGMDAPVVALGFGLMAICAVWIVGLSWFLITESWWLHWWFRMSRADRKAWRRVFRG